MAEAEGEGAACWLSDPAAAPHSGETLVELFSRVGGWLDALPIEESARALAVVEPDVVRAAVLHALGTPGPGFWRLDVQPLPSTELSGRHDRWNIRRGW